jgi:hypothetical protein
MNPIFVGHRRGEEFGDTRPLARRCFQVVLAIEVERPGDRMDGFWDDTIENTHPTTLFGQESAGLELLQVMTYRRFGKFHYWSQNAGAGL